MKKKVVSLLWVTYPDEKWKVVSLLRVTYPRKCKDFFKKNGLIVMGDLPILKYKKSYPKE
jgi:hypothetical protein